jgi:Cas6b C-terminal domain/Cas6b N-terminal domain
MSQLRILSVTFDTHLDPWELPRFRGAIAHKVGLEHEWFHNHDNETGGYHQRYPLIQYKLNPQGGINRPMLLCLEHGVEEAQRFFSQPDWGLRIGEKDHEMRIARLNVEQHRLAVLEKAVPYRIHKWKAFNPENFDVFRPMVSIAEQCAFLERLLATHIIAFAGGVGWEVPERFQVRITDLIKREWVDQKGIKVLAFTLDFQCNVALPSFIGLGKGASIGYGVLRRQARERSH